MEEPISGQLDLFEVLNLIEEEERQRQMRRGCVDLDPRTVNTIMTVLEGVRTGCLAPEALDTVIERLRIALKQSTAAR